MSCSHQNELFHRFCTSCGEFLGRTLCQCGAANAKINVFCYSCGNDLLRQKDSQPQSTPEEYTNKNRKPCLSKLLDSSQIVDPSGQSDKDSITQNDINSLFGKRDTDENR